MLGNAQLNTLSNAKKGKLIDCMAHEISLTKMNKHWLSKRDLTYKYKQDCLYQGEALNVPSAF